MNKTIEEIAKNYLFVDTLQNRNSDDLDFHSIPVWSIKEALEQAYLAGQRSK